MTSPQAHLVIIRCYTCRIQWQAVTPYWWRRQGEQIEHPCITAGHDIRFHKTGTMEVIDATTIQAKI